MAFLEDVVDLITDEISHIGLSEDGTTEYAGGTYAKQVPTYTAAASQEANLTATLEFDGTVNDGPITHLIFFRAGAVWVFRPVEAQESFNSDGRLDVTSASVVQQFSV